VIEDFDRCYRAVEARDPRFDGWFITAVTSTGIYCRPSCPAITPRRANVRFFATPAAAQAAGFRACKRCRPDASPGSPEWNVRGDLVARAMRLIADGVVEREGVAGLARRLHFSERHLHRQIAAELGAGPQAIARAYRAQAARTLVETTDLSFSEIAFAAGFGSIRQFNDTVREVFATSPSGLRKRSLPPRERHHGSLTLRLARREPFDGAGLFAFLGKRAVPGMETSEDGRYRRTLRLPHGGAIAELSLSGHHVSCTLQLQDIRDLTAAVHRCRSLLDLDADPQAVDASLASDPALTTLVRRTPGRRVPGSVDGFELACRTVLGQQVSIAAARTLAARIVDALGSPLPCADGFLQTFPSPATVADADLDGLGILPRRAVTVKQLAEAVATGTIKIDPGADRDDTERDLLRIKGIGPWTASYIRMRALGDPDVFLATDLGARKASQRLGLKSDLARSAAKWRPWRSYALQHLWTAA
jgi:AraC family transcriptional regulator, regulatory protein of adaptative response / DNA-3-methyladenine glycosylase II